jgi:hypothetical protein
MLRALNMLNRTAILVLGIAFAAAGQAPPAKNPSPAPAKSTAPAAAQAPAKAAPPAAAPAKAPAPNAAQKPAAKAAVQKPAPKPSKPAAKPVQKAAEAKKEEATPVSAANKRRDPFLALVSATAGTGAPVHLPPGKAGLQVATLRVDGIVRSQNGMLVMVTNPQGRTYFLHQGDRLFDGRVEQVSMDAVTFTESGKDPFGKTIERSVTKRIYPSAGEQQ